MLERCNCNGAGCKLCASKGPGKIFIPIIPMGAVRTTQRQKYVDERYMRYEAYKQELVLYLNQRLHIRDPLTAPIKINIVFYMPTPKSGKVSRIDPLTNKRRLYPVEHGAPHIAKPDIDNMIKGVFDAFNNEVWADDSQVFKGEYQKIYGDMPGIEFSIETY